MDGAAVALIDAGEHLHQGRFAGTVFTHQRVYLAAADGKAAVVQRVYAGEELFYALHAQKIILRDRVFHASTSIPSCVLNLSAKVKITQTRTIVNITIC